MCLIPQKTLAMEMNLPFAEVAQNADLVFIGTAAKQESRFNAQQSLIFTEVLFEDIHIVHANKPSVQKSSSFITLTYAGGCVEDLCVDVGDNPIFREGQRYLLFISDDGKTYINPIIGGSQGYFRVIKDARSGEEFVLTAGRKAVLGTKDQGIIKSKLPVSHIQDGSPVYDMSRDHSFERFFTQPPTAGNPSDKAWISFPKVEQEEKILRALTLSEFTDYIRNVALKVKLEKKILKKKGMGYFLKKKGKTIEKIPFEQLITPGEDINALEENRGISQNQYTVQLSKGESSSWAKEGFLEASFPDHPLGGQLGYCGYHSLPLVMEMVPEDCWSYDTIGSSMWMWNQFMDVYRIRKSDGTFNSNNSQNEFCGWIDDSTMYRIYGGHWNGYYGMVYNFRRRNPCGRILESDVLFNPSYNWTDDEDSALGNSDLILLRPLLMHELAHTWGMQSGKYEETYDYDSPTVVHSYYHHIVENGMGIHSPDAHLIRRAYSNQKTIKNIVDAGVESYYADDGLHNSKTDSSSYHPGDSISLYNITVENNSYKNVSDLRIRFYLSKNRNITTQDYQIGSYWHWDSFSKESYGVYDFSTTIPDNIPASTYYIGAIVTINGYNQDDFTNNNASSFYDTITIKSKSSGGDSLDDITKKCFIATAVFDSESHPYVNILRDFRDQYLMPNDVGRSFVNLYYRYSPSLADFISKHKLLRYTVRKSLLPLIAFCGTVLQTD
jgi:hypothetical protein